MKKLLPLALAAAAVTVGAPAYAAVTVTATTLADVDVDGNMDPDGETVISFNDSGLESPDFMESLTFVNDVAGLYNIIVGTSSSAIDLTEVTLSGSTGVFALSRISGGINESFGIENLALGAGEYTLSIMGVNRGTGGLGGTIAITSAVPEPATWMMLLLGFFGTGLALRRSKAVKQSFAFSA